MPQNEYEAKFLNIDVDAVRDQLRAAGAELVFGKTMFTRLIFENDAVQGEQWLRLRDEGGKTTLTLKQVSDATTINGTTEIEIEVDDLDKAAELLKATGLRQVRYQQNYREEWQLGDIKYDLDTWPDLPTFIEIEGPSEDAVRKAVADLGFDYEQVRYGSIDLIYKSELGRDILVEPTLLFGDNTHSAHPTAASAGPGLG
ncbi:class IV adenylate cyclase [Streptomyces albus]|uniref:class IV adenylate cyclase n=1 Tax=Streptomyces sp. NRRL F-5917 TaxID=1463873 RepID=UPI0004C1CE1C|nr:class IV adenylate cyclase [Streptomyces sp. NRRL F-5917]